MTARSLSEFRSIIIPRQCSGKGGFSWWDTFRTSSPCHISIKWKKRDRAMHDLNGGWTVGLEPTTTRTTIWRSTNWTTLTVFRIAKLVIISINPNFFEVLLLSGTLFFKNHYICVGISQQNARCGGIGSPGQWIECRICNIKRQYGKRNQIFSGLQGYVAVVG